MNTRHIITAAVIFAAFCGCNSDKKPAAQEPDGKEPFTIKVYDISAISATVDVEPADKNAPYYMDIINASDYAQTQKYGFDDYLTWLLEKLVEDNQVTKEEAIEMISSFGNDSFITTTLVPDQKYYAVAVGIDENGMSCTDVVAQEFSTDKVEMSRNSFEVSIPECGTSTATIHITTANDDPYIVAIEPSNTTKDLDGQELADYIIQNNIAWGGLDAMTYSSDADVKHTGKAGWDYEVIVFGYSGGFTTTEVTRYPFKMQTGGDPESCTFTFGYEFGTFEMNLTAVPSDNSVVYIGNVIQAGILEGLTAATGSREEALKTVMEDLVDGLIADCGTRERVIDLISLMGSLDYSLKFKPSTDYIQWVVPVDQMGNTTAAFSCSEVFTSPAEVLSKASLTLKSCKWYNGSELAELYPEQFKSAKGYAVIDMTVEASEEAVNWWSYAAMEDLTDRTREVIIKNVTSAPTEPCMTRQLITAYWGVNTIMGVAQDADGVYGPLMLHVIDLTKDGASAASEFEL